MFFGPLGDKFGARRTFSFCLIAAGISMLTFGWWSSFHMLALLLFLNGSFQSLCWPSSNKGLGAWVSDAQRNTVFGYYGTCPFVGGILGTALAVSLLDQYGWRHVHSLPSFFCVINSLFIDLFQNDINAYNIYR